MDHAALSVWYYLSPSGSCPFKNWLDSLDCDTQRIVVSRIPRVRRGHFGDFEYLGEGIFELKFHVGPGYRIYFGKDGMRVVVLIQGGDKKGPSQDIEEARARWKDYLRRTRE